MSRVLAVFAALVTAFVFGACTKNADKAATSTREVNLAIWGNYLSPEMQQRFTKETGIKLNISNYSSNEELLAKIQAGATGIDVAVPSDYMVEVLVKLDQLQALDRAKIPNAEGLDPAFMKQAYDPENKYSLPYSWTTTGIAINRDLYKGEIKGWKDVFTKRDLEGKVSLLDDVREVTAGALKMNGFSVNAKDPEQLKKAQATLKDAKPRVKMFRSDTIDLLVNKEVAVAHTYSTDALKASRSSGGSIEFVLPEEGGTRAIDNMVLLKSAKHAEEAHALINFLLNKDVHTEFVKTIFGGPVVLSTKDALPADLKTNTSLFPPAAVVTKLESIQDVGDATQLYDRLWTEIKSE